MKCGCLQHRSALSAGSSGAALYRKKSSTEHGAQPPGMLRRSVDAEG